MSPSEPAPRQGRGPRRFTVLLVLLAFAAPMLLAWLVLQNEAWRPGGSAARGTLVRPARPLPSLAMRRLDGSPLSADELRGRWTLVYITGSVCSDACRKGLYYTRQIRLAVGKDTPRVQRLLLFTDTPTTAGAGALRQLLSDHPDLIVATASGEALDTLLKPFRLAPGEDVVSLHRIYMLDPVGNLMMYYEPGAEPKGILKDLERLLKASHIG
jgi:cytochrome oxidase Cu insertion factor (SCO1/SenC/PrrC family)